MLRVIFHFLNAEFVCSIDNYQPSSVAWERFLDRVKSEPENIKYKFHFAQWRSKVGASAPGRRPWERTGTLCSYIKTRFKQKLRLEYA